MPAKDHLTLLLGCNTGDRVIGWQAFLSPEQLKKAGIFPWIGILKVRSGNKEFATGLTLISDGLAAANSNDISKLDKGTLRISTKAIFFKHNVPWYCDVTDYEIHPEFDNINLTNTLAVLFLECDRQNWTSISWPSQKKIWKNVYAVGLNDRNYDFEQMIFRMKFVNKRKCFNFYIKEEIDFKSLWPKNFWCSKGVDIKKQCVFDSGMALVSLDNRRWTLIGISILGPGCVLPSRFIDILPYISWMSKQKNKRTRNYRRQMRDDDDENSREEVTAINSTYDIVSDGTVIYDDLYVEKLNHETMVLRPKYANVKEVAHGHCNKDDNLDIMYKDAGIVRTSKKPATGVYALSLYDMKFYEVSCVVVTVVCDRRSQTKFWFEMGFKTDDVADLINFVPHFKMEQTVPPKILFLTDAYANYENIRTANLVFKFEFTIEATINVDFYGVRITTTPATTTTTTPPRKPRTHRYHIYNTRRWVQEGWFWSRRQNQIWAPRRKLKYRTKTPF